MTWQAESGQPVDGLEPDFPNRRWGWIADMLNLPRPSRLAFDAAIDVPWRIDGMADQVQRSSAGDVYVHV